MITIYLKQFNKIVRNADVKLFDELGYDDILWIDLLTPSIKEQKAVENFMEINLQTQQQVEEIESSSKYSETENAIICNSNFFMPYTETFAIEPVSFIIAEGVLVSVRNAEFRTFTEAAKRLQMNYRAYATGYHVLVSILEVRIDYDADLVEALAKNIAALSQGGEHQRTDRPRNPPAHQPPAGEYDADPREHLRPAAGAVGHPAQRNASRTTSIPA